MLLSFDLEHNLFFSNIRLNNSTPSALITTGSASIFAGQHYYNTIDYSLCCTSHAVTSSSHNQNSVPFPPPSPGLPILPSLLHPFIQRWTFRLCAYLGYCKQQCNKHNGANIFSNQCFHFLWAKHPGVELLDHTVFLFFFVFLFF